MKFSYAPSIDEMIECNLTLFKLLNPRARLIYGAWRWAIPMLFAFLGACYVGVVGNFSVELNGSDYGYLIASLIVAVVFVLMWFIGYLLLFCVRVSIKARISSDVRRNAKAVACPKEIEIDSEKIIIRDETSEKRYSRDLVTDILQGDQWIVLMNKGEFFQVLPREIDGIMVETALGSKRTEN